MVKLKVLRYYLFFLATFLLIWWPLSHWFFPEWYHSLLGFESFDPVLSNMIGTTGVIPVIGLYFAMVDPLRNKSVIVSVSIFSLLMSLTYHILISRGEFPMREYINAGLLLVNAILLIYLTPWKKSYYSV